MEKITLTLNVTLDMASRILALMRDCEPPKVLDSLEGFEEITPTEVVPKEAPKEVPMESPKDVKPVSKVTLDELRHAFVELSNIKGKIVAKKLIASLGYAKVTEIPESEYENAISKVKGAM